MIVEPERTGKVREIQELLLAAAQHRLGKPGRPWVRTHEPVAVTTVPPRLMGVEAAAAYLGVSAYTIRDMIASGQLARVRMPASNGSELRRLLVDRDDLDGQIESWKTPDS